MENEEFINEVKKFRKNRILKEELRELIKSEEETKLKLINPFLKILGYDVEEPGILVSEDIADFRNKKGKKVDYIAYKKGKPLMLIEAKYHKNKLSHSTEQLDFYFNTKVKDGCHLALLTNGIEYRFFSDLQAPNTIDEEPFFVFDLKNFKDKDLTILQNFIYDRIDADEMQMLGRKLKNYSKVFEILKAEIQEPSDELSALFARKVSDRQRITANIVEEFRQYLKEAFEQINHSSPKENTHPIENPILVAENTSTTPTPSKTTETYTEDDHLKNMPDKIVKMYMLIRREILALENVVIEPKKVIIRFLKNKKSIVEFVIQSSKIRVFINLKYSEIKDSKNRIRDVSNVGRWGTGECEFTYENIEDINYLLSFIKQSYQKNA